MKTDLMLYMGLILWELDGNLGLQRKKKYGTAMKKKTSKNEVTGKGGSALRALVCYSCTRI